MNPASQSSAHIRLSVATGLCLSLAIAGASSALAAPAPYSLPWLLRPTGVGNVVRVDETLAMYNHPSTGESGSTAVTSLIATWKVGSSFAPLFRVSWVANNPPDPAPSGTATSNPLFGVTWARAYGAWRGAGLLAVTLSVAEGGGDSPAAKTAAAVAAGIPARSAMDNALFAANYSTVIAGAGLSHVNEHLTAQAEITVLRLLRARGPGAGDDARTNLTAGLHVGHYVTPRVSVGAELRLQRWMTDAAPVVANDDARETYTAAIGPRFHFPLAGGRWVRPGVSWTHAIDRPLSSASYDMFQIDVPVSF